MATNDSMRDPHVDYVALANAELDAREKYPDAFSVRAVWTPASEAPVHVEVWTRDERTNDLRAKVVPA